MPTASVADYLLAKPSTKSGSPRKPPPPAPPTITSPRKAPAADLGHEQETFSPKVNEWGGRRKHRNNVFGEMYEVHSAWRKKDEDRRRREEDQRRHHAETAHVLPRSRHLLQNSPPRRSASQPAKRKSLAMRMAAEKKREEERECTFDPFATPEMQRVRPFPGEVPAEMRRHTTWSPQRRVLSPGGVAVRCDNWAARRKQRLDAARSLRTKSELDGCTFVPFTNERQTPAVAGASVQGTGANGGAPPSSTGPHAWGYDKYIERMRIARQRRAQKEDDAEARFATGETWTGAPTVPSPFQLSSSRRDQGPKAEPPTGAGEAHEPPPTQQPPQFRAVSPPRNTFAEEPGGGHHFAEPGSYEFITAKFDGYIVGEPGGDDDALDDWGKGVLQRFDEYADVCAVDGKDQHTQSHQVHTGQAHPEQFDPPQHYGGIGALWRGAVQGCTWAVPPHLMNPRQATHRHTAMSP